MGVTMPSLGLSPDIKAALDMVPECIAVLDDRGAVIHINSSFSRMMAPLCKVEGLPFVKDLVRASEASRFEIVVKLVQDAAAAALSADAAAAAAASGTAADPSANGRRGVGGSNAPSDAPPPIVRDVDTLILGPSLEGMPIYRRFDWAVSCPAAGNGAVVLSGRMVTVVDEKKKEAEQEFMDFFNKAPIALHWLSGTGNILWANEREMEVLGYTAEEYIGKPVMNFCPDDEALVLEIFKQLGSGKTIRDVPVRFRSKTGRIRNLLIDSNVNYHPNGTFNHTRCFIRDDTERKVREARAEAVHEAAIEAAASKDLFVRKIFHEVRTPCHVLASALSQLRYALIDAAEARAGLGKSGEDSASGGDCGGGGNHGQNGRGWGRGGKGKQQQAAAVARAADDLQESIAVMEMAGTQAARLLSLVDDAADAAMFDSGRTLRLQPEPFSPRRLTERLLAALAKEKPDQSNDKVQRTVEFGTGPAGIPVPEAVVGDERLLYRVLHHLLENAIMCTSAGEVKLTVTRETAGNGIMFRVSDTGCGLSETEIHNVFQRFWHIGANEQTREDAVRDSICASDTSSMSSASLASGCEGLGIGLNVSFNIVQCMGGELKVSCSRKAGTQFWFTVDLPEVPPEQLAAQQAGQRRDYSEDETYAEDVQADEDTKAGRRSLQIGSGSGGGGGVGAAGSIKSVTCGRSSGDDRSSNGRASYSGCGVGNDAGGASGADSSGSQRRVKSTSFLPWRRRDSKKRACSTVSPDVSAATAARWRGAHGRSASGGPLKGLRWTLLSNSKVADSFITGVTAPSRDEGSDPIAAVQVAVDTAATAAGAGTAAAEAPEATDGATAKAPMDAVAEPSVAAVSACGSYQCGVGLGDTRGPHILLVDDNTICQRVARKCLETLGCTADVAGNGRAAVDALRKNPAIYDLVLMDLRMPVMDGIRASVAIRNELRLPDLPIVAFSAEIGDDVRMECADAGMEGFLPKPASLQTIRDEVRRLLPFLPLNN